MAMESTRASWRTAAFGTLVVVVLLSANPTLAGSFSVIAPIPPELLKAQATCVKYLGVCEGRLAQYNHSIYPADRTTMSVVRCVGLMLGFWDDTQGLQLDGFISLYPQLAGNSAAQRRIQSCADRRLAACIPQDDASAKAFAVFHCLLETSKHNFTLPGHTGNPLHQRPADAGPQLPPQEPFSGADFAKAISVCGRILRVPANTKELYRSGVFPNSEQTHCVLRCVGIQTGLYDDARGPHLSRLYELFGAGQSEADFRRRAAICVDANGHLFDAQNKCAQAYRKLYLCFKDGFGALVRANANAIV